MNDRHALLLSSLILAALLVAAGLYIFAGPRRGADPEPVPVPAFSRAEFSDTDLRGQVSIVNIFASWCPPCEAEHGLLMQLKTEHGIAIYGINYKDSDSGRLDYLQRLGNPYIAVTPDREGNLAGLWGMVGVPESFVVDGNGMIRYHLRAPLTDDLIRDEILPLIRKIQGASSITLSPS